MARKPAKNVPGTERYRDERREEGGPRMHSREWHDHEEPRELESVDEVVADEVALEAETGSRESGGDRAGMGRSRDEPGSSQGRERRKRTVPPSKGVKRAGHGTGRGQKGSGRA